MRHSLAAVVGTGWLLACGHAATPAGRGPVDAPASGGAPGAAAHVVGSIAASGSTACAVADGAVYCWGANGGGQLGDGTMARRATAARVAGVDGATQVTVGGGHACAVLASGDVRCWGDGSAGQLGDGHGGGSATATVTVRGLEPAVAVAAGYAHTCAITRARTVRCWGKNHRGQLGDGTFDDRPSPVAPIATATAADAAIDDAVQIAAIEDRTCALRASGALVCWGGHLPDGRPEDDFAPPPFDDVASFSFFGSAHAKICMVRRGGALLCGGHPLLFRDATLVQGGSAITCALRGANPMCWSSSNDTAETFTVPDDATSLAVGGDFACVARASGGVACWGGNDDGQLGDGRFGRQESPVAVKGVADAIDLAVGDGHTCVARRGGDVFCWGNGAEGQLAGGGVHDARDVVAGAGFACALRGGGALACWGNAPFAALDGVSQASAHGQALCAVRRSGAVTCARTGREPWTVAGVADAVRVSAGEDMACALRSAGALACWGYPKRAGLPEVSEDQVLHVRPEVVEVPSVDGGGGVADFAVGALLFVVTKSGRALSWQGPTAVDSKLAAPVPLGAVDDAVQASPPCVLRRGGAVACFSAYEVPPRAQPVATPASAVQLSAGAAHACVRLASGGVACWGSDALGRLGDGHTDYERAAAPVIGLP